MRGERETEIIIYLLPEAAAISAGDVDGLHVVVPFGVGVTHYNGC